MGKTLPSHILCVLVVMSADQMEFDVFIGEFNLVHMTSRCEHIYFRLDALPWENKYKKHDSRQTEWDKLLHFL